MDSKPEINAAFVLDKDGEPEFVEHNGQKHYKIRISIVGAPKDAVSATYQLHESYFDPIRELHNQKSNFEFETTSYGDYGIRARLHAKRLTEPVKVDLYNALKTQYSEKVTPALTRALLDIKEH